MPVDVGEVIREVVAELSPLLGHHQVEVHGGVRLYALADAAPLRQILEHLVENAVKYAPPESAIRIDWQLVEGASALGVATRGRASRRSGGSASSSHTPGAKRIPPAAPASACTPRGGIAGSMGAPPVVRAGEVHGARFVISLPAAAAV